MTTQPPHRIRRLRWRVGARSQAEAFGLRTRLLELEQSLRAEFDRAFTELIPGDEVVHLPSLSIRLRVSSMDELSSILPEVVQHELRDQLRLSKRGDPAAPSTYTLAESRLNALVHYIETGNLPWFAEAWSRDAVTEWARSISLADATSALLAVRVSGPDHMSRARVFRLLQLLPESVWSALMQAVLEARPGGTGRDAAFSSMATTAVEALSSATEPLPRFTRIELASLAIAAVLASTTVATVAPIAQVLREVLGGSRAPTSDLIGRLPLRARPLFARLLSEGPIPLDTGHVATGASAPERIDATVSALPPHDSAHADAPDGSSREQAAPFGLVVGCAGLALLHPLLIRFFDSVAIERATPRQLAPVALPRAAALLYFLATGEEEAPEHELGLVKVLLGIDPNDPLPIASGLVTDTDRAEVEVLLQAAIDHWKVLGSTSKEGLRRTFLDRRGLLRKTEVGFQLHVEPAPFDVLLQKLPWGFGVIKLPWMPKPLFTEWPLP